MTKEELEALDAAAKIREGLKNDPELKTDHVDEEDDNLDDNGDPKPKEEKKPTISDNEAKLVKEVMKHKNAYKRVDGELKQIKEQIAGLNLDEIKELLAQREADETTQMEKKGEYDRLLQKQREAADAKIKEADKRADEAEKAQKTLQNQIEDLTTGAEFNNSKFIKEKLTLTPNKAKQLYKTHFEFIEGKMVAHDKPKGESDRTPIVGSDGQPVSFEDAIEAIINADPDKDYLLRADMKTGAGSKKTVVDAPKSKEEFYDTTDKIAAGLEALAKSNKK